ncbi:hypothetical protein [Glaesserella sp.]
MTTLLFCRVPKGSLKRTLRGNSDNLFVEQKKQILANLSAKV